MRMITTALLLFTLLATPPVAQADDPKSWKFSLEPYLLASSISGDAGIGRAAGIPVDVSFSDILENLQLAGMAHFEAQHDSGWGVILDYGFMDLGADTEVGFGGVIDAGVRQGILEALVSRRFDTRAGTLDALAGIRWWDNRVNATFDPGVVPGTLSTRIDQNWVDPVIGARWTRELDDRWQLRLRGDIGGFGAGSDFSWNASATGLFAMTSRLTLEFGYKAVAVDFDNGKDANGGFFAYDTTTQGPIVGLIIDFQ
jgi:hypothetical protein